MDLSKILSVTGIPNDGVATLDNISIFTEDDDVSLQSVLLSIYKKENGAQSAVNVSDNNALKAYFAEILPNYDRERVYVSNMKKVILWYNQLVEKQLIDDKEEEKTEN